MNSKESRLGSIVDNLVLDRLVKYGWKNERGYMPSFIARRLIRSGVNVTTDEAKDSLEFWKHYNLVERHDCGLYAPSLAGRVYLRRN